MEGAPFSRNSPRLRSMAQLIGAQLALVLGESRAAHTKPESRMASTYSAWSLACFVRVFRAWKAWTFARIQGCVI